MYLKSSIAKTLCKHYFIHLLLNWDLLSALLPVILPLIDYFIYFVYLFIILDFSGFMSLGFFFKYLIILVFVEGWSQ